MGQEDRVTLKLSTGKGMAGAEKFTNFIASGRGEAKPQLIYLQAQPSMRHSREQHPGEHFIVQWLV